MKKKTVIILIAIFCFLLCFFLGYIIVNRFIIKNDTATNNQEQNMEKEDLENEQLINKVEENKEQEQKVSTILPNSKIGSEILKNFQVTNVYSEEFYKLLDSEGLSNKVKASMAYINIMQGNNYNYMLEYSDETADTYISKENIMTAINDIFYNSKDTFSKDIIYSFEFDEKNSRYIIPAVGMTGRNSKVIIEVPYEILEYPDKYEVNMYRVHLVQTIENKQNDEVYIKNAVYYDNEHTQFASEIVEEEINSDLNNQRIILENYIKSGKINSARLQKTKYTLIKDGQQYKISEFKI